MRRRGCLAAARAAALFREKTATGSSGGRRRCFRSLGRGDFFAVAVAIWLSCFWFLRAAAYNQFFSHTKMERGQPKWELAEAGRGPIDVSSKKKSTPNEGRKATSTKRREPMPLRRCNSLRLSGSPSGVAEAVRVLSETTWASAGGRQVRKRERESPLAFDGNGRDGDDKESTKRRKNGENGESFAFLIPASPSSSSTQRPRTPPLLLHLLPLSTSS